MDFIITHYSFIFLAAVLVSLLAAAVIWQKRSVRGIYWLILAMLAVAVWSFFAMLDISSPTLDGRILWSKLEYLGANTAAPLLLLFFLNYPHRHIRQSPELIVALFILPLFTISMVMVNQSHYLFWTGFEPIAGSVNGYIFLHGPFYWVALIYNYLCGTAVVLLILRNIFRYSSIYQLQSIALLVSSFFPYVAGLAYSLGGNPFPGLDILPVAFSIGGFGVVISVIFLRMFDLVPVGRNLLVENLQDGVVVLDRQRRIVDINPAARRLLADTNLKVGDGIDQTTEKIRAGFDHTKDRIELTLEDPLERHLQFIPNSLIDETGLAAGYLYVVRDVTDIRKVEMALHQSQERYRSLIEDVVDDSSVAICILDDHFRVIWVNQAATEIWELKRKAVIRADMRKFLKNHSVTLLEHGDEFVEKVLESYGSGQHLENVEIHFPGRDGKKERWMLYSSKPIRVGYYVGGRIEQYVDISEQKRLLAKIELLAITDELTGIYNRRGLFELGMHDFDRTRRTDTLLSAIYLDIDYFKDLNDRFGHAIGDQVLMDLTKRIQIYTRDMDTFARYGGDEFVILIPDASIRQAGEVAERIRSCIADTPFNIGKNQLTVSISLGVAQLNKQDSLTTLLDRADRGMYRAKQNGRNRVEEEEA